MNSNGGGSDETLRIEADKMGLFWIIARNVAMIVLGGVLVAGGHSSGWVVAIGFLVPLPFWLYLQRMTQGHLLLQADGFEIVVWKRKVFYRWEDVTGFDVIKDFFSQRIKIRFRNHRNPHPDWMGEKLASDFSATIPLVFGNKLEDVARTLEGYRARHVEKSIERN